MPDDDDRPDKKRGLIGRARRLVDRATRRERSRDAPTTPSSLSRLPLAAAEAALAPVLRTLGTRMVELADFTASRLLELDEAAAELAVFVERVREHHADATLLRVLMRHNLLLNGTMLSLLEPALRGRNQPVSMDPAAIGRARDTMTDLIVVLAALDAHDPPADGAEVDALPEPPPPGVDRLGLLEDLGFDAAYPNVFAWLEGRAAPEDDARFVFGSYMIFLQTFLLRAMSRQLLERPALGGHPAPPMLPDDDDDDA